jgi:hypothetical protein
MKDEQGQHDIPELLMIREIVQRYMPAGHRLNNIDLSFGVLEEGQEPRFLILIDLEQERHAPEPFGWADKMTKIIRAQWPKDDFYIKLKIIIAPEPGT